VGLCLSCLRISTMSHVSGQTCFSVRLPGCLLAPVDLLGGAPVSVPASNPVASSFLGRFVTIMRGIWIDPIVMDSCKSPGAQIAYILASAISTVVLIAAATYSITVI